MVKIIFFCVSPVVFSCYAFVLQFISITFRLMAVLQDLFLHLDLFIVLGKLVWGGKKSAGMSCFSHFLGTSLVLCTTVTGPTDESFPYGHPVKRTQRS